MNIISFSLYGHNKLYLDGILQNISLAKKLLPMWICRIYYKDIPNDYINIFNKIKNIELIEIKNFFKNDILNYSYYKLARYLPLSDIKINKFIVMDADGRICKILQDIIDIWNSSDKTLYFCLHADDNILCGGLWGCKGNIINNIEDIFKNYVLEQYRLYINKVEHTMWGLDQRWLNNNSVITKLINKKDYISFIDKTAKHYIEKTIYDSIQLPLSDDVSKLFNCNTYDILENNIQEKDYTFTDNKLVSILDEHSIDFLKIEKIYPNFKNYTSN